MKITCAEFIKSVYEIRDLPKDRLPQIAIAGRSNVGKSSLLNALLQRRKLAQVSATPGKTQCLNFYRINNIFYFVDLPGYGYARAPKQLKKVWHELINNYLSTSEALRLVLSLVDLRHDPSPLDLQLWQWLEEIHRAFVIIGTKSDKLSNQQLQLQLRRYRQLVPATYEKPIIAVSIKHSAGREAIWRAIADVL